MFPREPDPKGGKHYIHASEHGFGTDFLLGRSRDMVPGGAEEMAEQCMYIDEG
jgi:hypothetical protein